MNFCGHSKRLGKLYSKNNHFLNYIMLVAPYATRSETVSETFLELKSTANKETELLLGNSA